MGGLDKEDEPLPASTARKLGSVLGPPLYRPRGKCTGDETGPANALSPVRSHPL